MGLCVLFVLHICCVHLEVPDNNVLSDWRKPLKTLKSIHRTAAVSSPHVCVASVNLRRVVCPITRCLTCVSLQRASVGRDVRGSVLQPVDPDVRPEQTVRLRLRRYSHTAALSFCFSSRRGNGFSAFCVFRVPPVIW